MQQDTANFYQFLYHVILVVSFRRYVFAEFTDGKLVSTHKNDKTFYMLIIRVFLIFRQPADFVVQRESAKSGEIFRS